MRRALREESTRVALAIVDRVENLFYEIRRVLVDASQLVLIAENETHEKSFPFVHVPERCRCLHEVMRLDDYSLELVPRGAPPGDVLVELPELVVGEILRGPIEMASVWEGAEAWVRIPASWEMVAEINVETLRSRVAFEACGPLREPGVGEAISTVLFLNLLCGVFGDVFVDHLRAFTLGGFPHFVLMRDHAKIG